MQELNTGTLPLERATVDWAERLAVGASFACLVHCLGLPLLVAVLPALSAILAVPESFHVWVLAAAIPLALVALLHGRARHGRSAPMAVGVAGLALLAAGAFLLDDSHWEAPVTVTGSLLLAGAHIANWRMRHACAC